MYPAFLALSEELRLGPYTDTMDGREGAKYHVLHTCAETSTRANIWYRSGSIRLIHRHPVETLCCAWLLAFRAALLLSVALSTLPKYLALHHHAPTRQHATHGSTLASWLRAGRGDGKRAAQRARWCRRCHRG